MNFLEGTSEASTATVIHLLLSCFTSRILLRPAAANAPCHRMGVWGRGLAFLSDPKKNIIQTPLVFWVVVSNGFYFHPYLGR